MAILSYRRPDLKNPKSEPEPITTAMGFSYVLASLNFAIAFLVASLAGYYSPDNHFDYDIRWLLLLIPPSILCLIIVMFQKHTAKPAFYLLAISIVVFASVTLSVNHFNLLVKYEVWIQRGMPDRWQVN